MREDIESFIHPEELLRTAGLREGQTLVHLGCGAGFYLIPAACIVGKKGAVIGIDVLPDMLAEAESRAEREGVADIIRTARVNIEAGIKKTVPDDSADWVLVANILHQSKPERILNEAARIARPDGRILVVEWDTSAAPFGPPVDARVGRSDAKGHFEDANLHVERELDVGPYHYGLILSLKPA